MNPIVFPTSLSDEEHALKEIHEKLKSMRRLLAEKKLLASGDASSTEKNRVRKSVEDAAFATEELKKKIIAGAIKVKKVKEKRTFKRANVDKKTRTTSICEEGEIDVLEKKPRTASVCEEGEIDPLSEEPQSPNTSSTHSTPSESL